MKILIVSDGAFGDLQEECAGSTCGVQRSDFCRSAKSGKNVAITGFSVRRYPLDKARYEVMLEIMNMNTSPTPVELTLLGDGVVADITRLSLGAGERVLRFYKDLAGASRTLEAKIAPVDRGSDQLPADNHAYALDAGAASLARGRRDLRKHIPGGGAFARRVPRRERALSDQYPRAKRTTCGDFRWCGSAAPRRAAICT